MMRKFAVASLALSPLMLHAQANLPLQPQDAQRAPVLQSWLTPPTLFVAAAGTDAVAAKPSPLRVSTGVTAPRLLHSVDVDFEADSASSVCMVGNNCKFLVGMVVDKTGRPSELRILQSADKAMESSVLAAVSRYRFAPGTVSNQPINTPVNLEVDVIRSAR